jgi:hypothetical protein
MIEYALICGCEIVRIDTLQKIKHYYKQMPKPTRMTIIIYKESHECCFNLNTKKHEINKK